MNKEDQNIKPIMQIILGIGLFAIYKLTFSPIQILSKWEDTNWYDPSDEFFFFFLKWVCLISSVTLIIVGSAHLIKRYLWNG